MKIILIFTLFIAVALSGCAEPAPVLPGDAAESPATIGITEGDSLLSELTDAIEAADLNYARIDVDGSAYDAPESVRVTKELLRGIGGVILAGNPERLEPSVKSASDGQTIMVQFPFGEGQYASIQLFAKTGEQPDKTMMWLQLGEDMPQYALDASAFKEVHTLVAAQTFPKEILLEGSYIRYVPMSVDIGKIYSGLYLEDVLEADGKLLFLWREGDIYRLEAVNPQTGESTAVWEYTVPHRMPGESLKLENTAYAQFDYRITGNGMVTYRSTGDPAAEKIFEAPEAIRGTRRMSYDVHPQTGTVAYSADDGVYAGSENNVRKVLDNKDAPQPVRQGTSSLPDKFGAYFGEVHLLDGGRQLAATVIHPGSQSGKQALALVDPASGKVKMFENLFSAMVADVQYIGDTTVAALSIEQVTVIDVESGQTEQRPFEVEALTNDFDTYITLRKEKNEAGVSEGFVVAFRIGARDKTKQLLKVTGENAQLNKVTQSYTILLCKDSKDAFAAIVPMASEPVQASSQVSPQTPVSQSPPPVVPFSDAPLVIHVVDGAGNPVANLSGTMELGLATADTSPPGVGLSGTVAEGTCSGSDGNLYFTESADMLPQKGSLILSAYYDSSMRQTTLLDLSSSPTEVTVVWEGSAPPYKAADPTTRRITFRIVDERGNPVANVSGGLTQTSENVDSYRFLYGEGQDSSASDESGSLYLELESGWESRKQSRSYTLMLYGHFDSSLQKEYQVELSDPPASYTITWALPHPPKERPPQATGIRLFIVDTSGDPVQGVELGGSPYPKETIGDIPEIAMILGPSDKQGYIRWDDAKPGTYMLVGSKDGKSQKYEIKVPEGETMADITLTWNPQ